MGRCDCPPAAAGACNCAFASTDCMEASGSGSGASPLTYDPILDPAAGNLLQCGSNGLGAFLPDEIAEPPSCGVSNAVSQSIPDATFTLIDWDAPADEWDNDSMHDPASNAERITINTPGVYQIVIGGSWDTVNADERTMRLMKNGTVTELFRVNASGDRDGTAPFMNLSWQEKLAAGEFLAVQVRHSAGGPINLIGAKIRVTWVSPG